jgi:type IV secretion system protein VirB5
MKHSAWVGLLGVAGLVGEPANAAMAVIDVRAIAQLTQQLRTMRDQLAEARASLRAVTGTRGMQNVLAVSEAERNYLPRNWAALETFRSSGAVQALAAGQAALPAARLATFSATERTLLEDARSNAALLQGLTREALARASGRFESLRALQSAIAGAADAKAIADLSGRIEVENGMLANEQAKLDTLYQLAASEQRALEARQRELTVVQHGEFAARLAPRAP